MDSTLYWEVNKSKLFIAISPKQLTDQVKIKIIIDDFFELLFIMSGFQKWIGYQDVKSMPTYFYVQKTKSFSAKNTPIPFERAILNIGGAMNLESGKFKAPVAGTYFFSFIGLVQYPITSTVLNELSVMLYQNGQVVGRGQFNEVDAVNNVYYLSPVTVQSTLMLKAGDEVWLEASYVLFSVGYLFDSDDTRYTHFNGWLLEEDIAHSL